MLKSRRDLPFFLSTRRFHRDESNLGRCTHRKTAEIYGKEEILKHTRFSTSLSVQPFRELLFGGKWGRGYWQGMFWLALCSANAPDA